MRADYAALGLGEYAPAFASYHHGQDPEWKGLFTTIVFWDCFGDPMLLSEVHRSSSMYANWCGVGWAYPDYWCQGMGGHRETAGIFYDMRPLAMLKAGCCPLELSNEILGTEGTPD